MSNLTLDIPQRDKDGFLYCRGARISAHHISSYQGAKGFLHASHETLINKLLTLSALVYAFRGGRGAFSSAHLAPYQRRV